VPKGTAVKEAIAFANNVGEGNRHAVELTKRLIQQAEEGDLAGNHALELAYCQICQAGEEVPRARDLFKDRAAARAAAKARES
jgi:2-(1,2-epoxy-1,2-dihydrophenyl)acetyl-CoA isomerase